MSKSEWVEWDAFPDPPKRRRKQERIVEILSPRQPEPTVRIDVHHHRRERVNSPQRFVILCACLIVAAIVLRSPGALILLAVIIPAWIWVTLGVIVAALVFRRTVLRD